MNFNGEIETQRSIIAGHASTRIYDPHIFHTERPEDFIETIFSDLETDNPERRTVIRGMRASFENSLQQAVQGKLQPADIVKRSRRRIEELLLKIQKREYSLFMFYLEVKQLLCNLRCRYCWLTNDSAQTVRRNNTLVTLPNVRGDKKPLATEEIDGLSERVRQILINNQLSTRAPVLKIAGGEILLLPEVIEAIREVDYLFRKIQILTNGTLFEKYDIDQWDPEKYLFQVSLDGHTQDMNQERRFSDRNFQRIFDGLKQLRQRGFNVEINMVLTDTNIAQLPAFADYMKEHFPGVTIFPFPIRTFDGFLNMRSLDTLKDLSERRNEYGSTLPPRAYFEALIANMEKGRSNKCYIPLLIKPADDKGDIVTCPCSSLKERGNSLDSTVTAIDPNSDDFGKITKQDYPQCRTCYTHFDIMSLFVDGKISAEELSHAGMFQDAGILAYMEKLKGSVRQALQE